MPASGEVFKQVLSRWASGVSVVTTNDDGQLYGLTVSSFSSVSLDPPLVMVCLNRGNRIVEMIERSGRFAVSILGRDQEAASNYFARPRREPTTDFTEIDGEWVALELPIVKGAFAWAACSVHQLIMQGDHCIAIGQVEDGGTRGEGEPLLYFDRAYRSVV